MNFLLADRQDITRAGIMYLLLEIPGATSRYVKNKEALIDALTTDPDSVVVLDYTLFDFFDMTELTILGQRFSASHWVIFSEDLSSDFVRTLLMVSQQFSVVLKESALDEIRNALTAALNRKRYVCQRTTELLFSPSTTHEDKPKLTKTEIEILKDIALGLTTKEIADKRFSSFHTVNTHRKNIFRKLEVNNVHEATKYALRAGLIDSAEYYI